MTYKSYEEKNERLNEIVKLLENGELSLDESTKLFEEASELVKNMKDMLKTEKGKITQIKEAVQGYLEEDF